MKVKVTLEAKATSYYCWSKVIELPDDASQDEIEEVMAQVEQHVDAGDFEETDPYEGEWRSLGWEWEAAGNKPPCLIVSR